MRVFLKAGVVIGILFTGYILVDTFSVLFVNTYEDIPCKFPDYSERYYYLMERMKTQGWSQDEIRYVRSEEERIAKEGIEIGNYWRKYRRCPGL